MRLIAAEPAKLGDKVLENIYFFHIMPRHKVEMSVDTELGGFQHTEEIHTDGLHLPSVGAALVQLKQLLRPTAIGHGIDLTVIGQIVVAENLAVLIVADVGQLLILVGFLVHGLFYQFTGNNAVGDTPVIPAINLINTTLAAFLADDPVPHIAGGAAESVGHRQAVAACVGDVHIHTELAQIILIH